MRRLPLDTYAALFWWSDAAKLGHEAGVAIGVSDTTIMASPASAGEISTKHRLGKLADIGDPAPSFLRLMQRNGFESLPVTIEHGLRAAALPGTHRDPFDRLIAAQGLMEDAIVVPRDREIAAFGSEVLW